MLSYASPSLRCFSPSKSLNKVSAGNGNTDAGTRSPGRQASLITVGASTIGDARAAFSNHGESVDIFAPGEGIISASIGSTSVSGVQPSSPPVLPSGVCQPLFYLFFPSIGDCC